MKKAVRREIKNKVCVTPGCGLEIGERSITCLCKACYSYIYTNQKRTTKQLVQRSIKIRLFQSRLNFILPSTGNEKSHNQPELLVMPGHVKKYRRRSRHQPPLKVIK